MAIDFLRPLFLLLLPAVPLLWFFPRRRVPTTQGVLRSSVFALVIAALAGPVWVTPDRAVFQVFVLDQSGGIGAAQRERALGLLDQWKRRVDNPGHSAVIVVGAGPESGPALPADLRNVVRIDDPFSRSALGDALAAAERQIPDGATGVVTLVTDGLATDRRWGPTVQRLIARGIPVATYDLGRNEKDIYPTRISADPLLRVGQTARFTVEVVGTAPAVRVRLSDAGGGELALSAPMESTGRVSVPLEFEPRDAGFLAVRAELVLPPGADADLSNNRLERTFAVQGPLRVMYAGDRVRQGAARLGDMLGRGFAIDDAGERTLDGAADPGAYDLVMVDDRPASRLPEAFQTRLETAVRQGGLGLIFSGGKAAFGAGGYDRTALAEMLPVDFVQRSEKRDPSTALAVIVDTSGSMAGLRIELAKQIVRLAMRRLKAHDRVGIVEFYGNKHWALPLQSAANKIAIDRAVGRMQASGGTVMYPAIEEAYYGLKNVSTRYKHILVITDAGVEDADFESLVRLIAKDNVNLSTVLVGGGAASQSLIDMAAWGRGRFYSSSDRYNLPEIVLKQATTMNLPAYKTGSFPVVGRGGAGWWGEVDRQGVPAVGGYVETRPRAGADIVLEIEGTAHPLLSSWHYGLGRVTALMTEPMGDGAADWKNWKDYGRWLARVASRTAGDTRPFRFEVVRSDQNLTVNARRYDDRSDAVPRVSILDAAGGTERPLEFRRLTPGHFSASLVVDPGQPARLRAGATDENDPARTSAETLLVSDASADISAETQVDPATALDLPGLATATGGSFADAMKTAALGPNPVPPVVSASLSLRELWPYLALLALLLYIAELAHRRRPRNP